AEKQFWQLTGPHRTTHHVDKPFIDAALTALDEAIGHANRADIRVARARHRARGLLLALLQPAASACQPPGRAPRTTAAAAYHPSPLSPHQGCLMTDSAPTAPAPSPSPRIRTSDRFVAYVHQMCASTQARAALRRGLGLPVERCTYMHRYLV